MLSKVINNDALAIIFDGESIENDYIIYVINNELASAGIQPWKSIEADIYSCAKRTLVIARPSPPLCVQGLCVKIRRTRK